MQTATDSRSSTTDKVSAAHDTLIDLVNGLQSGADWKAALDTVARFHRYSFANSLLIAASHARAYAEGRVPDPQPDVVAGYRTWQALGRQVLRGQQGHTILCPRTHTVREAVSPAGDRRPLERTEQPASSEQVTTRSRVAGWTTATVFSLSQTDGETLPLPPRPVLLNGAAPPGLWDGLVSQVEAAGFHVTAVPSSLEIGGANGVTNFTTRMVRVRADMDEAARVKTLAHDHTLLHDPAHSDRADPHADIHRGVLEVEAESVAYLIGAAHGMDTTSYTLPYVATWAGGTDPAATVRTTAERVVRTARTIPRCPPHGPWPGRATTRCRSNSGGTGTPRTAHPGRHRSRGGGVPVTPPRTSPPSTDLSTLALAGLGAVAALGGLLWVGAWVAATTTGHVPPSPSMAAALAVLADPGNPAAAWGTAMPGPVAYWTSTTLVVGSAVALAAAAGLREVRRRARHARPSLHHPAGAEVGYRLGRSRGVEAWASVEDSMLLVGPPRSGKGLHLVIPMILDAPGAVVTTSTRPDNLTVTLQARHAVGPIAVFDPQQLAAGVTGSLRWSPVRSCELPQTAMIRARALAAGTGMSRTVDGGDFWQGQTETVLRALLHAAALDGRTARDLYRWSLDPATVADAITVLGRPGAAPGWDDALEQAAHADPRTRDSIWLGVRQALSALADPRVLDAVTPPPGQDFDPEAFLRDRGTLYVLGTASGAGAAASLVAALVEDMVETARRLAAASPRGRLEPHLLLALDEIGNLAPLPSLPALMSEGGGSGITTLAVLQSLSQARDRWGEQAAGTLWDAAIAKIILGGGSNARDLADLATLIGERDDHTLAVSCGTNGEKSTSTSVRRVPVMDTSRLRTLPFGTAVLLLRTAPPIVLDLAPWTARRDARTLTAARTTIEERLRTGAVDHRAEQRAATGT